MTNHMSHRRRVKLEKLLAMTYQELLQSAASASIAVESNLSRWELITRILRSAYNAGSQLSVVGTLRL